MANETSPLPWTYDRNAQAVREANGFRIAMVDGIRGGNETDMNGILMTAAPELLTLLIRVKHELEYPDDFGDDLDALIAKASQVPQE